MKIKVYNIVSGDIDKIYTLTTENEDVTIDHIEDIIKQAKKRFKILGKQYTIIGGNKVFHAYRLPNKRWKIYQLSGE